MVDRRTEAEFDRGTKVDRGKRLITVELTVPKTMLKTPPIHHIPSFCNIALSTAIEIEYKKRQGSQTNERILLFRAVGSYVFYSNFGRSQGKSDGPKVLLFEVSFFFRLGQIKIST